MTGGTGAAELEPGELRFEDVSKRYRADDRSSPGREALRSVTFTIAPGESVGLIGPNGAGKTTALKAAAGITVPTSGRILRRGRTLAVIELGAGIHPDLTGRENIEMLTSLATDGRNPIRRGIDEIVEFAGLEQVIDRPARHLSTGMIARMAFAAATHAEPTILLLDEVLSVGDLRFQQRCLQRLLELRRAGTTVILASHDLDLIRECCDRTLLISDGMILSDDDTDAVVDQYLGRPTREASGSLPLTLQSDVVDVVDGVRADLEIPADLDISSLAVEVVVRIAARSRSGVSRAALTGAARFDDPAPGRTTLVVPTGHLPPGRYDLHVRLEGRDHTTLIELAAPFTLTGAPGPMAIRLAASASVDGGALERMTPR